jgi:hypothetical protein
MLGLSQQQKDPFLYSLYTNLYSSLQSFDLRFVKLPLLDY